MDFLVATTFGRVFDGRNVRLSNLTSNDEVYVRSNDSSSVCCRSQELFRIVWASSRETKFVKRLNLIIEDEDQHEFQQRVISSRRLRNQVLYILPNSAISQFLQIVSEERYHGFVSSLTADAAPESCFLDDATCSRINKRIGYSDDRLSFSKGLALI